MLTSTQRCNKYLKLDKTVGDVEDSKSRRAPHCRVLPLDVVLFNGTVSEPLLFYADSFIAL